MAFKITRKGIFFLGIISFAFVSFLPSLSSAALVPCGPGSGGSGEDYVPCELCHIFVLIDNVVKFVLQRVVPMAAVLMFILSGIILFGSAGDPGKTKKAKDLFTSVVIGLLIAYGAYLLISVFLTAVGVAEWTGLRTWFQYPCP